jgi:ABC-type sulfate/molybdate transport systems ATPase subunit
MSADGRGASLLVRVALAREGRAAARDSFSLDVALDVPPGFTILSGPSGAGKSTLLGAVAGFHRPTRGHIALGDETWFDADRGIDLAPERRRVAIVFQSLALFPHMTATQNVAYGMARSLERSARRALAAALLERLRVAHVAHRKPPTFSGGEAQRVALARALANSPRVVLLDEPFSALDAALRRDLAAEVREILRELNVPVIFVTHQPDEARREGDQLVTLENGRVVQPPPSVQ